MMGSHQKYSCAVRMVSILAKRLPGIEMLPGAELDFLSFHLPPLFSAFIPPSLFCSAFCLFTFFPAPHLRNAGSRSGFSSPSFHSLWLSVSQSVCLSLCWPCLPLSFHLCFPRLPPCSDLFHPHARHSPVLNFEPNSHQPCEKVMCSLRLGISCATCQNGSNSYYKKIQNNYSRYKLYIQLKRKKSSIKKCLVIFASENMLIVQSSSLNLCRCAH